MKKSSPCGLCTAIAQLTRKLRGNLVRTSSTSSHFFSKTIRRTRWNASLSDPVAALPGFVALVFSAVTQQWDSYFGLTLRSGNVLRKGQQPVKFAYTITNHQSRPDRRKKMNTHVRSCTVVAAVSI